MPEQDPTVRRLNAEAARERADHDRAMLFGAGAAAAGIFAVFGLAHLLTRKKPETVAQAGGTPRAVRIDAVVPAHNEATTIAGVVGALRGAGEYGRILVVDDGSTDDTAATARAAGAEVIRLPSNVGKLGAMLAGVRASTAEAVAFWDADALDMTAEHARALPRAYRSGRHAQVCGTLDSGPMNASRLATGQRVVSRRVLDEIPATCTGYAAETAINFLADRFGTTQEIPLPGLHYRTKAAKVGTVAGMKQGARMAAKMAGAFVALNATGGASCVLDGKGRA